MKIDKKRYDRQIRVPQIGLDGQQKLNTARLLIVGCGALGTHSAEQLTRAGVGELILIDPDVVELSNLQRQTLFTTQDAQMQRPKVLAARDALLAINPELRITPIQESFEHALFDYFGPLDLVLDCTDNFLARELINDFCLHHQLPFVFASAAGTSGQVMALNPQAGPCLSCLFPNLADLEKNCETVGVITPLIPLVSSLEVSLALQILSAPDEVNWETLHLVEAWPIQFATFTVKKRRNCACCTPCLAEKTSEMPRVERSCGGVYQSMLSPFDVTKFEQFATEKKWKIRSNPLAMQVKFETYEITIFKKGRILFYHFEEERMAQEIFEQLRNL